MKSYELDPKVLLEGILTELKKSKNELLDRVKILQDIIKTSHHEGERDNANTVLIRVLAQLKNEYNWEPKQQSHTQQRTRQTRTGGNQAHQNASNKYQKAEDSNFKIVFFGRFQDPNAGKRGSDKVWGWGVKGNKIYQFWGPTGKTPQVKTMDNIPFNRSSVQNKSKDKQNSGYKPLSAEKNAEWILKVLRRNPKFSENIST